MQVADSGPRRQRLWGQRLWGQRLWGQRITRARHEWSIAPARSQSK
jgi:hypothetical protein